MKKTVLVSLFVFISFLANAQNWKSHPKKPYSGTDSCLVWQDSTKKFYRIKCSEINTGGSSAIDTTKVGRIEQGRGTAPIFMYFNGVAWVRNDTSYVPQSGTNKFSGNLLSNQSFLQVGLGSANNTLTFTDEVFTGIKSASATSETQISAYSTTNGYADISVYNPLGGLYDRRMVITGTGNNTPDQSFRIQNGLLYYYSDYRSYMTDDKTIPDIGKVKQLISDSVGTVQSTTLADGKIWIGDGTDTAFPRTLSGDVTVSNLGVTSYNGIVPSTKGGAGTVNGILKANGSGIVSAADSTSVYNAIGSKPANYVLASPDRKAGSFSVRQLTNFDFSNRNKDKTKVVGRIMGFGDSNMVGFGTTTPAQNTWIAIVANTLGVSLNNQAVSSTGAYTASTTAFSQISKYYDLQTIVCDYGYNNIRRSGYDQKTYNMIKAADNSIILSHFSKTQTSASTVTSSGTWSNFTTITTRSSAVLGGNARTSSTAGNTLTWTTPTTSSIGIGCFGTDGTIKDYGRFTVSIDGTVVTTYNSNVNSDNSSAWANGTAFDGDGSIIPNALFYNGLSNTTHTVVITLLDNKTTPIDYFAVLLEPQHTAPIIFSTLQKMTAGGYAVSGAPNGSDNAFNGLDSARILNINTISSMLPYKILVFNTNNYVNPAIDFQGDLIHLSDEGHKKRAKGFIEEIVQGSAELKRYGYYLSETGDNFAFHGFGPSGNTFGFKMNSIPGASGCLNPTYGCSSFAATADANGSKFDFYTANTVNTTPTLNMTVGGNGDVTLGTGAIGWTTLPTKSSINFGKSSLTPISSNGNIIIGGGATFDGTNYIAQATTASLLNVASNYAGTGLPGIGFICNTGLTASTSYTPSEVARISSIGAMTLKGGLSISIDNNFTTRNTNSGSDIVNLLYITNNTGITDMTKSALVVGSGGGAGLAWAISNGTRMINRASIVGSSSNNTAGSEDGVLDFYTSNAGTGQVAAMRIDKVGNIGIGTTSPNAKLQVTGTVIIQSYTVATLPACAAGVYQRATVTDALAPVYDATVAGGGARVIEVLCNGSTWVCH